MLFQLLRRILVDFKNIFYQSKRFKVKGFRNKGENQESLFLIVFSFLLLFNFAIFGNIVSFIFSGNFFVLLILLFKSIFDGLIGIVPHSTDNFSDFCDFSIWMF